jgi:hypothetical protein
VKRTRLRPRSAKAIASDPDHAAIRAVVIARDRVCQVAAMGRLNAYATPPCFGPLTPHHRRKASAGGRYSASNLVAVCAGCNGAMESDADLARWAHEVGLVVRRGDPEWAALG